MLSSIANLEPAIRKADYFEDFMRKENYGTWQNIMKCKI